jgi:hypothetical protein
MSRHEVMQHVKKKNEIKGFVWKFISLTYRIKNGSHLHCQVFGKELYVHKKFQSIWRQKNWKILYNMKGHMHKIKFCKIFNNVMIEPISIRYFNLELVESHSVSEQGKLHH